MVCLRCYAWLLAFLSFIDFLSIDKLIDFTTGFDGELGWDGERVELDVIGNPNINRDRSPVALATSTQNIRRGT